MLKMLPSWPNALSTTTENVIVYSWFLLRKLFKSHGVHASHTSFLLSWRGSSWISPGFSALQYRLFWEFASPRNENRTSSEKRTVCQLPRHVLVQTEETNHKNVLLQPDDVPSKYELPLSYTVAVVTVLWSFVQTFTKHSSPELTNFLRHLPVDSYLKYSCTKNRRSSTVYLSRGILLRHWRTEKWFTSNKSHDS
jgi:hypothetical protein